MNRQRDNNDGNSEEEAEEVRYTCPDTGSHFEFLDMC
jgi:hypothetical protein